MRLTREDNRESLKRYRHIKPARAGLQQVCLRLCPGTTRTCSRERGHRGPHVAFGVLRRILAVWEGGEPRREAQEPSRRGLPGRRPVGLRSGRPSGPLAALSAWVRSAFSSAEELAWAAFFLAFVGFAAAGFLLIYLG